MSTESKPVGNPQVVSLGLAVLDTIKFGNGDVVEDVLGGSGAFCTAGARLFVGASPGSVAWKILVGEHDFPFGVESQLRSWGIELSIQKSKGSQSTRGLLEYEDSTFGPKKFRYTTPVLQVEPEHLQQTIMLASSAFHILCGPEKIQGVVSEVLRLRGTQRWRPLVVWEPTPPVCVPENLEICLQAVQSVDVFSPNHLELLRFCGQEQTPFSRALVEHCAARFLTAGIGREKEGVAVIRAGEHGCVVMGNDRSPATWIPPYYKNDDQAKIIDPTGAGNGFLGGFMIGFLETSDFVQASHYGAVAASFMLEQIGVPTRSMASNGVELWNEDDPRRRLAEIRSRLKH